MNLRSFRFRLASWHALGLLAAFGLAGVLLHAGLRHYLESNLTEAQERRAERIAQVYLRLEHSPDPNLAAEITTGFAPEASDRFVRIVQADRRVRYQSGPPVDQAFAPGDLGAPPLRPGVRKQRLPNGDEMVVVSVASDAGRPAQAYIEVGESLAPALNELGRLLMLVALAFAVVAAIAIVAGVLLVKRALRPVEEITRRAETITSRNLSERLPVPPTGDEFERLSQTLNGMIARLDEAFQHNRRFLTDASHELRTPLTILRSELEGMVARPDLDQSVRDVVANLLEEAERLVRIVETLVALSRFETGRAHAEHERFDFAALASSTAEQLCLLAADKGQTISCETPAPVPVEGDRSRLKQVIVNLLDNAIKYTPNGGSVSLSVRARGEEAVCEVVDNGIGIPADALPRIFDRFFRVDAARSRDAGGAGIGLAIVKVICAAHGGRVDVDSQPGQGSRFTVRLPLAGAGPAFPSS